MRPAACIRCGGSAVIKSNGKPSCYTCAPSIALYYPKIHHVEGK